MIDTAQDKNHGWYVLWSFVMCFPQKRFLSACVFYMELKRRRPRNVVASNREL